MPRKLSSEDRKVIEAKRFEQVFDKLAGNPDAIVSERDMRILGHDCPDSATTRAQLFRLLEEREIDAEQTHEFCWQRFHHFLWPHHARYLYEAYHAGKLSLREKAAA